MRTTARGQSPILMLDVIEVLSKNKVSYAIVGAMAASVHGQIRGSVDADAIISMKETEFTIENLEAAFKNLGLDVKLSYGDSEDPIALIIVLHDSFQNKVDLLVGIRGMSPDAFKRTIEFPFMGQPTHVVGVEDFIAMKLFAESALDIDDAKNAIAVSFEKIDFDLLRDLTARYGKRELEKLEQILFERE